MAKIKIRKVVPVLIPLVLLVLFGMTITFPDHVFFLNITPKSYDGLGEVRYTIETRGENGESDSVRFSLKKVPAGVSPGSCSDIPAAISVEEPFLLAETEVTGALWDAVCRSPASAFFTLSSVPVSSGANHPLERVSWREAVVFCNALSVALGFNPVYYLDTSFQTPARSALEIEVSRDHVFPDYTSNGFRLPRSAEWELAARYVDGETWDSGVKPSGGTHPYYFESRSDLFAVYAKEMSEPVKSRASNRLGLYDMSGNVWEWCFDSFARSSAQTEEVKSTATASAAVGEPVPDDDDRKKVVRGGSWLSTFYRLQIGGEFGSLPELEALGQGFRIARSGW